MTCPVCDGRGYADTGMPLHMEDYCHHCDDGRMPWWLGLLYKLSYVGPPFGWLWEILLKRGQRR